ncbi:hypothetical protein C8J57DRAFT_1126728 [Mycena rebaudengoi]|nr:hypothetical protein C8J57DRAFT_1126728 [Mycena rebaudengoi]
MSLENLLESLAQVPLALPTYPVLTLPPELTSEIFLHCLVPEMNPDPLAAPLVFLAICRSWRNIALSTPALWVNLYLDLEEAHPRLLLPEKVAEFITVWFSRTGPTLALSFHCLERDWKSFKSAVTTAIVGYGARLQLLDLLCSAESCIDLPVALFPLLCELHLGSWSPFDNGQQIEAFQMIPLLQKLSLDGILPSMLKIPWQQLTLVVAHDVELAEAMGILQKAPYLRKFEFDGTYADGDPGPRVLHSNLVFLSLHNAERLIPLLTLPAIEKILISGAHNIVNPLPLISSNSLRSFTFGNTTPAVSLGWLQHMEHLTTLELDSPKWPHKDELLRALNRAHEPQFLPKLRNLALLECEFAEVTESLLQALHSRAGPAEQGNATLQSFRLQWPSEDVQVNVDTLYRCRSSIRTDELQKLVARGMEIYVGTDAKNYFHPIRSVSTLHMETEDGRTALQARLDHYIDPVLTFPPKIMSQLGVLTIDVNESQ